MRTRQVVAAGDEWRDETIAAMPEPTDQTRCARRSSAPPASERHPWAAR